MKTSVMNETTTAVSPTRTRNTMANRVRGSVLPRIEPPYPTYYPDTEYLTRFPDCQFFTYMPDALWYRDKEEEAKEECHLITAEIVVEFEGEEGQGEDCVIDMVEIVVNKGASVLGDGPLTAEMILDGKTQELIQVTNPGINIYRMDLLQAEIPESRRILKGKREIMIKLRKRSTTGYHYLTVGCDRKKRPYAHVMGRILPLPQPEAHYYCLTDHNKNVTGLVDSAGTIQASWDYNASGICISQCADKADRNPLKYSSEYYDQELGMIYYNYRHYNPRAGRWISRDLIEEKGGYNLYGYLENLSLTYYDYLGNDPKLLKILENMDDAILYAIEIVARETKNKRQYKNTGVFYESEYGARICCNEKGYYIPGIGKGGGELNKNGIKSPESMVPTAIPACHQENGKDQDEQKGFVHSHPKGGAGGLSTHIDKNGKVTGDAAMAANGIKIEGEYANKAMPGKIWQAVVTWTTSLPFNAPHLDKNRKQERWRADIYNTNGNLVKSKKGEIEYIE